MESFFSADEISGMSGGIIPPAPKNYRLPEHFPSLRGVKCIGLDLEDKDKSGSLSKDLGPGWRRGASIVGFALAIGATDGKIEFSEYYPCRSKAGPNLDPDRLFEWLGDELAFYDGEIVGANLLYDADGFANEGIITPFAKWRDIQWAEALIDENAFNYQLERIAKKYLGEGKVKDELKALYGTAYKERMDEIHPGHMRAYGIGDVVLPLRVMPVQAKELKRQKLDELYDLECRLLPMLLYMRRKGQRVDLAAAEQLHDKFTIRRAECLREATKLIGKRGFELTVENFGKPSVICSALDHLYIPYPKTELGKASIKDKWLEHLDHPFGAMLCAANKYDKALETFVNGYVTDFVIGDRLHPEFHPLRKVDDESGKKNGTVSGRLSSCHPNLQNIPARDDEIGPLCRAMFIAEEGCDLWSGDWSQIEYRLIVHAAVTRGALSQPEKCWGKNAAEAREIWEKLKSATKAQAMYCTDPNTDFHTMVANLTSLRRKDAKGVNFGIAFCMGLAALAGTLGLIGPDGKPLPKALEIMGQYHEKVPFVKAAQQALTKEAEELGYVETLLGRRTHFDRWEPKYHEGAKAKALPHAEALAEYGEKIKRSMTHKSLNRYTQGGGADKMKYALVTIWEMGLLDNNECTVSLTVHDELVGSVQQGSKPGDEKLREIQHIMETTLPLCVPTPAAFSRGANWSEIH